MKFIRAAIVNLAANLMRVPIKIREEYYGAPTPTLKDYEEITELLSETASETQRPVRMGYRSPRNTKRRF